MTSKEYAGTNVEVDDEGFMLDADAWSEDIAKAVAAEHGIENLSENHWKVIHFMRQKFHTDGTAPSVRALGKQSGVSIKELYQLFPKGPAKLAAKIAGVPKPRGCI